MMHLSHIAKNYVSSVSACPVDPSSSLRPFNVNVTCSERLREREGERETEIERDRQTETDRQRQRQRQRHRQTDRQRQRQTDRELLCTRLQKDSFGEKCSRNLAIEVSADRQCHTYYWNLTLLALVQRRRL